MCHLFILDLLIIDVWLPLQRSMCLGSFLVAVSPRETGALDMIRVFCAGLYSTQVARLEVKDQLFTCWLCDDSALEQLRLRIPGYVPGSKTVIPELTQTSNQVQCDVLLKSVRKIGNGIQSGLIGLSRLAIPILKRR